MAVYDLREPNHREAKQSAAQGRRPEERAHALPYEIRINGIRTGRFDDLRDAAASARIAKQSQPAANVIITNATTQRMIVEITV